MGTTVVYQKSKFRETNLITEKSPVAEFSAVIKSVAKFGTKPEKTKKASKPNKTDKAKSNGIAALTDALSKGQISQAEFIQAITALNK